MPKDNEQADPRGMQSGRRRFVQAAGLAASAVALGRSVAAADSEQSGKAAGTGGGELPKKPFGKTGVTLSVLGMGGHHLGDCKTVDEAIQLLHEAVDGGITFYDNCWEYWNGRAEDWLGRGLKGRRDKVFLMTKVSPTAGGPTLASGCWRSRCGGCRPTISICGSSTASCSTTNRNRLPQRGRPRGAGQGEAAGQNAVRRLHRAQGSDIHLDMIRRGYPFDAVQMPLNCLDANFRSFEQRSFPNSTSGASPLWE